METGFIWKGIHSSEKGLKIISLPNITTPEKREDKIIVPGRSGYLTIDNNSYEGEVKTVEFDIKHNNFDDIKSWLNGSGEVIFSNEPDRYYKARIINKVDLARVLEKFHSGIVQFDCQPFGYLLNEKLISTEDLKKNENLILNSGAVLDTKYWTKHVGGGASSYEIYIANRKDYPRSGVGFMSKALGSGWCMLANASLTNRGFKFDISKGYVLSCVIYANKKAGANIHIADSSYLNLVMKKDIVLQQGYNTIEIPFTPLLEGVGNYVRFALYADNLEINIFDLKLEEGNKATSWSLSPLDKRLYIENLGTRKSKSNITIEGTGDINLYVNKETIKLKNVEDKITINTEMMEAYKDTLPQNNKMVGEFPVLDIGTNNITWTGNVSRIEVQPNTIFL